MNIANLKKLLVKTVNKILFCLPTQLPLGIPAFLTWSQSIIDTYDFPDNDSVRFALATMVLHLGPTTAYKSKRYFSVCVKAGAAKQIAGAIFTEIKQKQEAAQKAAALTTTAEATAPKAASDGLQH